jgi:hypothetical protein
MTSGNHLLQPLAHQFSGSKIILSAIIMLGMALGHAIASALHIPGI